MIYLGYSLKQKSVFAFYNGVVVQCVENEASYRFIREIISRRVPASNTEPQVQHAQQLYGAIRWLWKVPHTDACWHNIINHYGLVQAYSTPRGWM